MVFLGDWSEGEGEARGGEWNGVCIVDGNGVRGKTRRGMGCG